MLLVLVELAGQVQGLLHPAIRGPHEPFAPPGVGLLGEAEDPEGYRRDQPELLASLGEELARRIVVMPDSQLEDPEVREAEALDAFLLGYFWDSDSYRSRAS